MIEFQLTLAGALSVAAFACFRQLPDVGDGSIEEATPVPHTTGPGQDRWAILYAFRDPEFCRYMGIFFLFSLGNLFYSGIVPAFFARDLGYGYIQATMFIHVLPATVGFLAGGRLSSWFDKTSVWRSYALVALLWGLDPLLLAIAPFSWPVLALARIVRGPATVGSIVLAYYTGVHFFARPGRDTSCYMAAFVLVNGLARLVAPSATAVLASHLSHRMILFCGAAGVLTASALFLYAGRRSTAARPSYSGPFEPVSPRS
jgi:MFS family permease